MAVKEVIGMLVGFTIVLAPGGLFLIFGIRRYFKTRQWYSRSTTTDGTVIDNVTYSGMGGYSNKAFVQFIPNGSQSPVEFESQFGTPMGKRQGSTVRVRYDPRQPSEAETDSFWSIWWAVRFSGFMVGFFWGIPLTISAWAWVTRHISL